MRRRPPLTLVAFMVVVAVALVAALVDSGPDPVVLAAVAAFGGLLVGLYLRVRIAWILATVLAAGNLLSALLYRAPWWSVAVLSIELALLMAPATRSYFFGAQRRARPRSPRTRRALRVGALMFAGLASVVALVLVLFPPDPVSGDLDLVRSQRSGFRVLFVGNSLTERNSMTRMVRELGKGDRGGPAIFTVQYARSGSTLEDALDDSRLTRLLEGEPWDYVVLQEHSRIASQPDERDEHMLPAAKELKSRARGDRRLATFLFLTWGYRDGDGDDDSYAAMRSRLNRSYYKVASSIHAYIAPVGLAWQAALARRPGVDLWSDDGLHPSSAGSYLAACVFYELFTHRDVRRSRYTADLDPADARWLQRIASGSVHRFYPSIPAS
jgi:hypothetical protein